MIRVMSTTVRILLTLALAALAHAQNCSTSNWTGTHYFLISGTAPDASNIKRPMARLGKFTADGLGNLTGTSNDSVNGVIRTSALAGSYTITGDCSGSQSVTFTPQDASPSTNSITAIQLVDGAQQAMTSTSDSRTIVSGRTHRAAALGASQCSDATLSGSYGFQGIGPAVDSAAAYSYNGGITFDGQGSLSFKASYNNGTSSTTSTSSNGIYSISGDCSGTASFDLTSGVTAHFAIAAVEGGNVLFLQTDQGALFYGNMQTESRPMILPQFAFGDGWYSALYFENGTDAAVSFQLSFFADNGTALLVPALGRSTLQIDIAARGTAIIEAPNELSINQGYASFTLPPGVGGYGVFRQSVAGRLDQEAVAPFVFANSHSSTLTWDDTTFVTSIAMVNPSPAPATVLITAYGDNGNVVGTSTVNLPPHQKIENAMRLLPGLAGMAGKRGRADFTATTGTVTLLGLRFNTTAFTSIPTIQQ